MHSGCTSSGHPEARRAPEEYTINSDTEDAGMGEQELKEAQEVDEANGNSEAVAKLKIKQAIIKKERSARKRGALAGTSDGVKATGN